VALIILLDLAMAFLVAEGGKETKWRHTITPSENREIIDLFSFLYTKNQ
jgi:hypothetical protein